MYPGEPEESRMTDDDDGRKAAYDVSAGPRFLRSPRFFPFSFSLSKSLLTRLPVDLSFVGSLIGYSETTLGSVRSSFA